MTKISATLLIDNTDRTTKMVSAQVQQAIGAIASCQLIMSNKAGGLKTTFSLGDVVELDLGRDSTEECVFRGTVQRINRLWQGGDRILLTCHGWAQDLDDTHDDPCGVRDSTCAYTILGALNNLITGFHEDFSDISDWSVADAGGSHSTDGEILTISPTDGYYSIEHTGLSIDATETPFLLVNCTELTVTGGAADAYRIILFYSGGYHVVQDNITSTGITVINIYEHAGANTVSIVAIGVYGTSGSGKFDWITVGGFGTTWPEQGGYGSHYITKGTTRWRALNQVADFFGANLWVDRKREIQFKMPFAVQPISCVLAYDFEEGSGSTAEDRSIWGNDGTITNAVYSTTAKRGKYSMDFDGDGDYINCGDIDTLDGLTEITIAAWVKWDTTAGIEDASIVRKENVFALGKGWTNNKAGFYINDGAWKYSGGSTTSVDDSSWHHIVGVYDGTEIKIYVDGVEENQNNIGATTLSSNANSVYVGCANGASEFWNGYIDNVQCFARALSAAEIAQLYHQEKNLDWSQRDGWTEATTGWTAGPGTSVATDNTYFVIGSVSIRWVLVGNVSEYLHRDVEDFTLSDYDYIEFSWLWTSGNPDKGIDFKIVLENTGSADTAVFIPPARQYPQFFNEWKFLRIPLPTSTNDHGWTYTGGGSASMTIDRLKFWADCDLADTYGIQFDGIGLTKVDGGISVKSLDWGTNIFNVNKLEDRLGRFSRAYVHYQSGAPYFQSAEEDDAIADIGLREIIESDYNLSQYPAADRAENLLSQYVRDIPFIECSTKGNTEVDLADVVTITASDFDLSSERGRVASISHSFSSRGWRTSYGCILQPIEIPALIAAYGEPEPGIRRSTIDWQRYILEVLSRKRF